MPLIKNYVKSRGCFKVTFALPESVNPENKEIRLLGDFNNWNWEQAKSLEFINGTYQVNLDLTPESKYEYRYLVDKAFWINDCIADFYSPSPYANIENCVVELKAPEPENKNVVKGEIDDFTKIEGVGPKIAQLILDAGFKSFEELSMSTAADLRSILVLAGKRYQMHDPTTWPRQSKLISDGSWDKFEKLKSQLKGGRKR